jgi:hypothetical protein
MDRTIQSQILNKHKTAVEALLGQPLRKGYSKKTKPPQGADAVAIAAFESSVLDEIWIYSTGRVHFTLAGTATKVDDKSDRDLPPDQTFV